MKLTGSDIRKQEFSSRVRGYDKLDVDAFLQLTADTVDDLKRQNAELEDRCALLEKKERDSAAREEQLHKTIQAVSDLRDEARGQTERLIEEARAEAERIVKNAREEAIFLQDGGEKDTRRARQEVERLEEVRDRFFSELSEMLRAHARILEGESDRFGVDLSRLAGEESGKIVSLSQKAEGERN